MPGPGPQRPPSWNVLGDVVGRVGDIAGRAAGGSLTAEARRQIPGSGRGRQAFTAGGGAVHQSETFHTGEALWVSDIAPITFSGGLRVAVIHVRASGLTPGIVGTLSWGDSMLATAPVNAIGYWAQTVPWPIAAGTFPDPSIGWPSAETGTLDVSIFDPG